MYHQITSDNCTAVMAEKKKVRPQPLKIGGGGVSGEATDSPDGGGKFSVDTSEKEYVSSLWFILR